MTCENMELRNKSVKIDVSYQYALFANLPVEKNLVRYSGTKPGLLNIEFKQEPQTVKVLLDVYQSTIEGSNKIIDLHFISEDPKNETRYEKRKMVTLKDGLKKVSFYDWNNGMKLNFTFKDISIDEWLTMTCPNEVDDKKYLEI